MEGKRARESRRWRVKVYLLDVVLASERASSLFRSSGKRSRSLYTNPVHGLSKANSQIVGQVDRKTVS